MNDVYSRLQVVLANTLGANVAVEELRATARLEDLVALDSVALLEFAVGVEREFNTKIEATRFTREFLTDLPGLATYLNDRGVPQ